MGSTFMDYKTHVFNAALEGNLMGLKVIDKVLKLSPLLYLQYNIEVDVS